MSPAPTKRQPISFGKYLLLDRVNIGGMAEVWRAKTFGAGGFERLVAIKRILPNIAEDEEFISMFIDEARITVQLNHANIAQIYELSHIANSYFIAMEYVSSRDLRAVFDRCRKRGEPAPIPLVCYVMSRCCEGFDYAHRKKDGQGRDMNIVHRDVSPQNVLVSYDGEVKVIDFGIAKAAGKATKTQAGILKGKFGYMSPEQIRGLPLDRRSDVFAIGVCLYEMLTGERLFVGDSDFSVLEKVRKVEVLPPSHFNRRINESLEKIVMKALAKDVEDRYQHASELGDDLQRFILAGDQVFGRKDLAAFMKATFAEEFDKEKQRLQEYADVVAPEGMAAAAAMGYGATPVAVPAVNTQAAAPSAVTSVPTIAPSMLSIAPIRSAPPVGASMSSIPAAGPRPSIPRLTPATASSMKEKEEHAATQMMDPDASPPSAPVLAPMPARGPPRLQPPTDVPTDPGLQAVDKKLAAAQAQAQQTAAMPVLETQHADDLLDNTPALGIQRPRVSERRLPPAESERGPIVPARLPEDRTVPENRRSSSRLPLMIGGATLVLLLVSAIIVASRMISPTGLLYIDLPAGISKDAASHVVVNVNGTELTGVTTFPMIRKVEQGEVTVMVVVPGYKPLLESVVVGPRGATHLTKTYEKEETAPTP